jgi:hemoglobin/transferrin/lactoferrin receptor protein
MPHVHTPRRNPAPLHCLAAAILLIIAAMPGVHAQEHAAAALDIPAQPLPAALAAFAAQSHTQVVYTDASPYDLTAPALKGDYTPAQALDALLLGSGLRWREVRPGVVTLERVPTAKGAVVTGTLSVESTYADAGGARDTRGYNDVYDRDLSSSYIGRKEVERFKGTTPSDLLNGVPGVFSGDARNSGALDVNIRGIQGPGRVPVTIDGTEQALTVWRGYNGATNRNYIDPFLIGGIQVLKGPSLTPNVTTGIGGAMVVNTLSVNDFVKPGKSFGVELKVEGSSNSTHPRLPTLHTGEDYRDVDGFPQSSPSAPYTDKTLLVDPKHGGGGYNVFNGGDHAYRLALGWRPTDDIDVLAAYAYRQRGNYFSGKKGADYYSHAKSSNADDYIWSMANYWEPGDEVPNTSSQTESFLFKTTWRPTPDQALQFGYRSSLSHYGEIMPSRIMQSEYRGDIQWPLSRVDAKAYNLEYKWNPEDSRWLDLYANAWRTNTISDTYTAGGFPNFAQGNPSFGFDPTIRNTAVGNATNGRDGLTLSNKFRLLDNLDLTVGGSAQYEKLTSNDPYFGDSDGWRMYPRAGRRNEWQGYFNLEWRPVEAITLTAGARYSSYWAFDDFLHENGSKIFPHGANYITGYKTGYTTTDTYTEAEREAMVADDLAVYKELADLGVFTPEEYDAIAKSIVDTTPSTHQTNHDLGEWKPDANGKFTKAGDPCLDPALAAAGGAKGVLCQSTPELTSYEPKATHQKDHGWVPFFSATAHFSDYSRAYVRYGETLRYPSMFESTIAFSAATTPIGLKPEHSRNWELAYVHDLSRLFREGTLADIKLAWYANTTRNVIERDANFKFTNIDRQTIRGLDFQARYDSGRFFTDVALNYQLKNRVCDESTAAVLTTSNGYIIGNAVVPTCVDYGFVGGYLLTQSTPKLSANGSLGGRFFQRKLELGTRVTYFRQYRNKDLDWFRDHSIQACYASGQASCAGLPTYTFNVPFSWGKTVLVDAYADYHFTDDLSAELTVTNLTDRYYVDPATRSPMAAPGRTLKLSLSARF